VYRAHSLLDRDSSSIAKAATLQIKEPREEEIQSGKTGTESNSGKVVKRKRHICDEKRWVETQTGTC
jgi:hypothetical protein